MDQTAFISTYWAIKADAFYTLLYV